MKKSKLSAITKVAKPGISNNGAARMSQYKNAAHFTSLPAEIRWMIWELSMPDPRVVVISMKETPVSRYTWSSSPIPNLLHICQESRRAALNHYELAFPLSKTSDHDSRVRKSDGVPRIFFDYSKDILYFSSLLKDARGLVEGITGLATSSREGQKHWLEHLKFLAIDVDTHWKFDRNYKFRRLLFKLPLKFLSLEQLLVMQDNRWGVYSLEGKGKKVVERVKDMAWMDERLGQSPRERDFVDTFDRLVEILRAEGNEWKAPQLKFVELVREWG